MSCNCSKKYKDQIQKYDLKPQDQCIFCAQKHFSTALALMNESGYQQLNRNYIIGQLVLAQYHINNIENNLAVDIRKIRHKISQRKQNEITNDELKNISNKFNQLIKTNLIIGK